jgi:hypothetical protein
LLAGQETIPSTDLSGWQRLWGRSEGDVARAEPWPATTPTDPVEAQTSAYRTADTSVAFASSLGADRLLGCDVSALPAAREHWRSLSFGRFAILMPPIPDDSGPPEVPAPGDLLYHGERLDLNRIDLGAYLQSVQQTRRLAPRVVLHLAGSGERFTTPIRVKGSSLVLYFEPPAAKAEPLSLAPAGPGAQEALLEVEQGSLDVINGRLGLSDAAKARVLPWLIKVRGGDVRLFRCRLEVPPKTRGTAFRGLISLDGSGDPAAEHVRSCAVNESVLVSARAGIHVQRVGARVLLTQSLLVAGGEALRLALDPGFTGRGNLQCLFERATVAARGCVVHLADVKHAEPPTEPIIVQTRDCGFLNPFPSGASNRAGLLRYEGDALTRGLLVWQSDRDSFDRYLWFAFAPATAPSPSKIEDHKSWIALWGTTGMARPTLEYKLFHVFGTQNWSLERLAGLKLPGAKLEKLGITKTPVKKVPR